MTLHTNPSLVLVINSGSSSLKFMLFHMRGEKVLARGLAERIGKPNSNLQYQRGEETKQETTAEIKDHPEALEMMCEKLLDPKVGVLRDLSEVGAIGHRVVHGGEQFCDPSLVDGKVKQGITDCSCLAPLHNPANLGGITACEKVFPGVPNVAVFDTAFHQSIPPHAFLYAIPYKYYERYRIRKYGFHGTSHQFVMQATAEYLEKPANEIKLISCHLGNGCSIAAIDRGKVVDTSMGMTPLAGLVMGTRCGDIDPGVVLFLARQGMTPDEVDELLNQQSGLFGLGGLGSGDMRDIVDATEAGDKVATRAMDMFLHRLVFYIGGYNTLLGGADAIVLTGGLGENSVHSRGKLVQRLSGLGCVLDEQRNFHERKAGPITTGNSRLPVLIIATNEELMIARQTLGVLSGMAS